MTPAGALRACVSWETFCRDAKADDKRDFRKPDKQSCRAPYAALESAVSGVSEALLCIRASIFASRRDFEGLAYEARVRVPPRRSRVVPRKPRDGRIQAAGPPCSSGCCGGRMEATLAVGGCGRGMRGRPEPRPRRPPAQGSPTLARAPLCHGLAARAMSGQCGSAMLSGTAWMSAHVPATGVRRGQNALRAGIRCVALENVFFVIGGK